MVVDNMIKLMSSTNSRGTDADKLNVTTDKPSTLTFIVK